MAIQAGHKPLLFWVSAAVILVILIFAITTRRPANNRRALYIVGAPDKGATLFYGDKQCGICHSVNGSGGRIAPDLSGAHPSNPAMGWIVTILWNHGPNMWRQIRGTSRPYPELTSQEMADILAFLYQASNMEKPGDSDSGAQVFREKGCVKCHSVGGTGGKSGPDLLRIAAAGDMNAWTSAMLNHAGSMVGPITSTLGEWPQFSGDEMTNLLTYVQTSAPRTAAHSEASGSAERGWALFQNECMKCHSVGGQGGNVGPGLGPEHDLPLSTPQFASVMWNHAPAMLHQSKESGIAPPQLQGTEMADLLTFLASLRYFEPSGSPLMGQKVFAERGCAACHGANAEGTQMGPSVKAGPVVYTTVSFTAALWRHGPKMFDKADQLGLAWPTLKSTDIGDLVSFLNASNQGK